MKTLNPFDLFFGDGLSDSARDSIGYDRSRVPDMGD